MNADQMIYQCSSTAEQLYRAPSEIEERKDYQINALEARVRELCSMVERQAQTISTMLLANSTTPTLPKAAEMAMPDSASIQCKKCGARASIEFKAALLRDPNPIDL